MVLAYFVFFHNPLYVPKVKSENKMHILWTFVFGIQRRVQKKIKEKK
jgi:hypothetical protein